MVIIDDGDEPDDGDDGDGDDDNDDERKETVDNKVGCEDSWPRTIPPIIISTFDGDYR